MTVVRHVVLLRLSASTPQSKIDEVAAGLRRLQQKLPGMLDVSMGANISQEGLSQGFTHGILVTFADTATRDAYLVHPDHEVIKQNLLALLEGGIGGAIVLDWHAPPA